MSPKFWRVTLSFAVILIYFSIPFKNYAQAPRLSTDGRVLFGGRILLVDICTCPVNGVLMYLKVGPPVPQDILITVATLQYLWRAYSIGNWTLGDALPIPNVCLDLARRGCFTSERGFPAIHIGTSLVPG